MFTVAILQVIFMVVLFSRTQEMEDEMALELRHSDKKYVHSYAWACQLCQHFGVDTHCVTVDATGCTAMRSLWGNCLLRENRGIFCTAFVGFFNWSRYGMLDVLIPGSLPCIFFGKSSKFHGPYSVTRIRWQPNAEVIFTIPSPLRKAKRHHLFLPKSFDIRFWFLHIIVSERGLESPRYLLAVVGRRTRKKCEFN